MKEWLYEKMVLARDFVRNPGEGLDARRKVDLVFKQNRDKGKQWQYYKKPLKNYAIVNPGNAVVTAHSLFEDKVEEKKRGAFQNTESPILVCAVKNDLKRIQNLVEHHRKLGIENFVFIDNDSDDGTYEWLMSQEVDVFRTKARYSSAARCAWLFHIFEIYGYDRWYLIIDSDELLVYPDCENQKIDKLTAYLEKIKCPRMLTFMLDMYTKQALSEVDGITDWKFSDYRYFDMDSYKKTKNLHYQKITGGPRERTMQGEKSADSIAMIQNKYPLVYLRRGEIYRYHYVYPFYHNFDSECMGALLHYKFLPGDLAKYQKIVEAGNYANGSQLYKDSLKAIKEKPDLNFWYDNTGEYQTSQDLQKIDIIKGPEW